MPDAGMCSGYGSTVTFQTTTRRAAGIHRRPSGRLVPGARSRARHWVGGGRAGAGAVAGITALWHHSPDCPTARLPDCPTARLPDWPNLARLGSFGLAAVVGSKGGLSANRCADSVNGNDQLCTDGAAIPQLRFTARVKFRAAAHRRRGQGPSPVRHSSCPNPSGWLSATLPPTPTPGGWWTGSGHGGNLHRGHPVPLQVAVGDHREAGSVASSSGWGR